MQIAGEDSEESLAAWLASEPDRVPSEERYEDWVVVSVEPVSTSVPEEVHEAVALVVFKWIIYRRLRALLR